MATEILELIPTKTSKKFASLFSGNPNTHYIRDAAGEYSRVDSGITLADIERHLGGSAPGLLSIPIMPGEGLCHFYAIDADRHLETDVPIDHVALALRITEL